MGKKVNSNSLRFGLNKNWTSRWSSKERRKNFRFLIENEKVWLFLKEHCKEAGVGHIEFERFCYSEKKESFIIFLHLSQPGLVLSNEKFQFQTVKKIQRIVGRHVLVKLNVVELKNPFVSAVMLAQEIATTIKNRIPHAFIVKRMIKRTMGAGALGIKVKISGRINGVEIARDENYADGSVPLSTLRADIDYCCEHVNTKYGIIGVKVWVNRGLYFGKYFMGLPEAAKGNRFRERDYYISTTY